MKISNNLLVLELKNICGLMSLLNFYYIVKMQDILITMKTFMRMEKYIKVLFIKVKN